MEHRLVPKVSTVCMHSARQFHTAFSRDISLTMRTTPLKVCDCIAQRASLISSQVRSQFSVIEWLVVVACERTADALQNRTNGGCE